MTKTRPDARAVAEAVTDPELPMLTLRDLGVLRDVAVEADHVVVDLAPTYSGCPAVAEMRADLTARLHAAGYHDVEVRLVLSPPWTSDDITEYGRRVLARHGIAPPGPAPRHHSGPVPLSLDREAPRVTCPRCGGTETVRLAQFGATACTALHRCVACGEPFESVKAI